MLPYPAVCYADFEATTIKDKTQIPNTLFDSSIEATNNIQIPNSFCLFCPDLKYMFKGYSKDPLDLFDQFWHYLHIIENGLKEKYIQNSTLQEEVRLNSNIDSKVCEYCKADVDYIVRHHDHFTGKFLGYACETCNLKMRKRHEIRIFFHNLKGYDSHFIIKYGLKKYNDIMNKETNLKIRDYIKVLGKSKEKLFSIQIGNFIFLDSYCHLPFSLSQLIKDYVKEKRFKEFLPDWYTHKEAYPQERLSILE
jgi:hypothetical protein